MTSQWKLVVVGSILLIAGAVGIYLWESRHPPSNRNEGLVDDGQPPPPDVEVAANPDPVILLLLDASGSLPSGRTRPGRDPDNREREATEILLRLIHHFSSSHEKGFAPRVGVLTFGASARWLRLDGEAIWQLRTPESLQQALAELDRVMGGTGEQDRRRGTYTDYNSAFDKAVAVLGEMGLLATEEERRKKGSERGRTQLARRPLVVLMTDGEHNAYPGHDWNYVDENLFDPEAFANRLREETLRSLAAVKDVVPPGLYQKLVQRMQSLDYCRHEPLEYFQALRFSDDEIAAQLEDPANRDAFAYALGAVRDVLSVQREYVTDLLAESAETRLFEEYIRRLGGQVRFQVVGLSPTSLEEIRGRGEDDAEYRLWNDLKRMVKASGEDPEKLRWSNDAGLVREFLTVFDEWLRLLRITEPLVPGGIVEVGGHVEGLALLAETSQEHASAPLWLVGPEGTRIEPATSRSGRHLFLLDRPKPGNYRLAAENQKLTGMLLGLIQTDPLFALFPISPRGRLGGDHPRARIAALSAETGALVPLHQEFRLEGAALEGELREGSGKVLGRVKWKLYPHEDKPETATEFELDGAFWTDQLARKPGTYSVQTEVAGFQYRDGTPVTSQTIAFQFEIEPTVLVSVYDMGGSQHRLLNFPNRCLRLTGK